MVRGAVHKLEVIAGNVHDKHAINRGKVGAREIEEFRGDVVKGNNIVLAQHAGEVHHDRDDNTAGPLVNALEADATGLRVNFDDFHVKVGVWSGPRSWKVKVL